MKLISIISSTIQFSHTRWDIQGLQIVWFQKHNILFKYIYIHLHIERNKHLQSRCSVHDHGNWGKQRTLRLSRRGPSVRRSCEFDPFTKGTQEFLWAIATTADQAAMFRATYCDKYLGFERENAVPTFGVVLACFAKSIIKCLEWQRMKP